MFVLILSQKKAIFCQCSFKRRKASELGSRSDSEHRLRSPTPTPTPSPSNWEVWAKPNNSSLIQPDLCTKADRDWLRRAGNRTIVPKLGKPDGQRTGTFASKRTIVRLRARSEQPGCGLLPGTRANNRRVLRLFLADQLAGPGTQSEQLFGFQPDW